MFAPSLQNRIASLYLVTTALITIFAFVVIYNIVQFTVYSHVDKQLELEVSDHLKGVHISNNHVQLIDPKEWLEKEHISATLNPVYVQIFDGNEKVVGKSPNLKLKNLSLHLDQADYRPFDAELAAKSIRQVEFRVRNKGKIAGYIIIAMSLEEPQVVLKNLRQTMLVSYPLILMLLFFTARFIAGRSVKPVQSIIDTANDITREKLNSRIQLPQNKDELYVLSVTINDLLDRIENAIIREKQFTSDASHELRTPLAVVKGTLEVLIRKPRDKKEYDEKIQYCIAEVDRLNHLVDQLLLLARFEDQKISINKQNLDLDDIILQSLERFSLEIERKHFTIDFSFTEHFQIVSDAYLVSIVIENLLSNAFKYTPQNGRISIVLPLSEGKVICKITDTGIGIPKDDLDKIYGQFYRAQSVGHSAIKGTGLGLSIVRRLCDLLEIAIHIDSDEQVGTSVTIAFS